MSDQLTLIADLTSSRPTPVAAGTPHILRPMTAADTDALGALYLASYPPGVACDTLDDAVADIRATFSGEYGELSEPASAVLTRDGRIDAAIMTVHRAPWPDTPDCPFVIELFTAPAARRIGLARRLVVHALDAVAETDRPRAALRVDSGHTAALGLYTSLGFVAS